jgi:copper resistance protein D
MSPDSLSVIVRTLECVGLLQAAGAAMFMALFGSHLERNKAAVGRLGTLTAIATLPLVVMHLLLDAARMAGEYGGMTDVELLRLALYSGSGAAHLVQLAGLVLLAFGPRGAARGSMVARAGAALVLMGFALTGHTSVHPMRWLLGPLLVAHVGIVAFWLGALAPLFLVTAREPVAIAMEILRAFSSWAGRLVPLIPVAGLGIALALVRDAATLRQPYGLLVGAKLLGFALLMALAALNRWRWAPALAADPATARAALLRSLVAEYLLIAAVLAVTAALTTFYSPDH